MQIFLIVYCTGFFGFFWGFFWVLFIYFFAVAYNVKFHILTISLNFKEWDLYLENNLLFN